MRVRLRASNRFPVRHSRLCPIVMQEAIDWIRGTSKRNDQAMDEYMAGATDLDLIFFMKDLSKDLIANFMRGNTQVTSLYLNQCNITQEGLVSLLDALQSSTCVEYFSLDCMKELVGQNMEAVANLVKHTVSIESLYLMGCGIDGDGVVLLCEALEVNKSLRDLNLSRNLIGSRGAEALGRYLKTNPALSRLELGKSYGTEDNLAALATGLKNNTNLEVLDLSYCAMSDREAVAFADALKHNTGLKVLELTENEIWVVGLVALAKALRFNRSLQKLRFNFDHQKLVKDIEVAFFDMLCLNVCLTSLCFNPKLYGDEGVGNPSLEPLLRRNRELIPDAVRRAALLLVGVCRSSTNYEGMGDFAIVPRDVVKLIAKEVWATRTDPIWMWAL